ncbi:uncharacterized protein LOC118644431 [Monomorium pharaonis]|uniref:uncharacterized protein LOC118644431 n=1 Tax=Monomorium pharaonis TaxID=307658 RepID=UPI0017479315|nr:uncharacterized protein LOC118644431 [Monomorium pharaonis]
MNIPSFLYADFQWWINILSDQNQANAIRSGIPTRELFSDASLSGWGAAYGDLRTHAAFYALKCFASDLANCDILLRLDNTTAISYINRFGSIQHPHLMLLAKQIWHWCEERNIFLFASYIASIHNTIADYESRIISPVTKWSLFQAAFLALSKSLGPFDMDFFASTLNAKCEAYVSWLSDPGAVSIDAFTISWTSLRFYAFPSFILIPRMLRKIINEKATSVVVSPSSSLEIPFPGGRELIRRSFIDREVPSHALEPTLASLTDSTIKQYYKPLYDWWTFCHSGSIPLFLPTPAEALDFLAQQLNQSNSYSTINTARSAISLISHNEIGTHPLIKRFCKGVSALKPPRPRYNLIWDAAPVVAKLATLYPYDSLPLKVISKKLALLLALATGQRVQTLAALRLSQIHLNW